MERNRTVITLDKFNYHRSSTERSNLFFFFRLLRGLSLSLSYKKKLRLVRNGSFHPSNASRFSPDSLSAFKDGKSVFERRISLSIIDRLFLSYHGDLSLSFSPTRDNCNAFKNWREVLFSSNFPLETERWTRGVEKGIGSGEREGVRRREGDRPRGREFETIIWVLKQTLKCLQSPLRIRGLKGVEQGKERGGRRLRKIIC